MHLSMPFAKGEGTPLVRKGVSWRSRLHALSSLFPLVLVSLAYLSLNVGLNFYNKYVLGKDSGQLGLNIPVFYTLCHQITGAVVYGLILWLAPATRGSGLMHVWSSYWPWLLALGFFFATSIVTNNMSFGLISLTVNSIIKSIMPAPTVIMAYFIQGYRPSFLVILSLVVLTVGVVLACIGGARKRQHSDTLYGYSLIIVSLLATTIRPVIASRIFETAKKDGQGAPISAVTMSFFDASLSVFILLPAALLMEKHEILNLVSSSDKGKVWCGIFIGSLMAGAYNYTSFAIVKLTSAVTFIVLGQFKQIFLIDGASLMEGYSAPIMWIGSTLVLLGGMWYAFLKTRESRESGSPKQTQEGGTDVEVGPKPSRCC